MGETDRPGHQLRRLVAGAAEHQALIAGAQLTVFPIHALPHLSRLVVEGDLNPAAPGTDAGAGVGVADVGEPLAYQALARRLSIAEDRLFARSELARDHDELVGEQGLAGYPGVRIPGEEGVEDAIRDLVGDIVRVAPRRPTRR